jgi:hypothetical protein
MMGAYYVDHLLKAGALGVHGLRYAFDLIEN